MKTLALALWVIALVPRVVAEEKLDDLRLLISDASQIKKDYLLTKKKFIESGSRADQFGKLKWTIPEIVKRAEKHIDEVLVPQVAPSMYWPPGQVHDDYPGYPIDFGRLQFRQIELCEHGEFFYWKVHFGLLQPIGTAPPFPIFVACYLDGTIAEIVDHKPDEDD